MIPGRQLNSEFDPRVIPTCGLWLDAADSNTIAVTSGYVSRWTDKSSNRYAYSNAATTGRTGPTRVATRNGLSVLTFTATSASDAAGQYLSNTRTTPFIGEEFCLFLVHKPDLTTGASYGNTNAICFSVDDMGRDVLLPYSDGSGNQGGRTWGINVWVPASTTDYNLTVFCSRRYGGRTTTFNGRDVSFVNASSDLTPLPLPRSAVGAYRSGSSGTTFSNFYSGTIGEILWYSAPLLRNQQQQVEGYLAWKWGLTSNLPTTHPFKSVYPYLRPLNPMDIPDCVLWFDAADTQTLTTSGTQVTRWRNKGVLSNVVATNTTAAPLVNAPGIVSTGTTFNTSSLNALQFPATTYLAASNVTTSNSVRTFFYIFTVTSFGDGRGRILASSTQTSPFTGNFGSFTSWNHGGNTLSMWLLDSSRNQFVTSVGRAPYSGTLPYDATPFIVGIRHTYSAVLSNGYNRYAPGNALSINGRRVDISSSPLTGGYRFGTETMVVGTGPGCSNVQRIGEILYYDRALSDSEMRQAEGYLCQRWGVTPADISHPYLRLPPMVPAFATPGQFPGCILWLDAADTTTLVTSGSSVTRWNDKSSNGFHVSFSAGPTTGTQTQNGNNVLVFSGNRGSNLSCVINSASHTLFAVHRPSAVESNTSLFRFQTGVASPYVIFPYYATSNRGYVTSAGVAALTVTGAGLRDSSPTSEYTLLTASVTPGNLQVFRNGGLDASSSSALTTALLPGLTIGATTTGTEPYGGTVAELLIFNTKLSLGQQQCVEGYLAKKWKI